MNTTTPLHRCAWVGNDPLYQAYHQIMGSSREILAFHTSRD
jgi:hypothetical protein